MKIYKLLGFVISISIFGSQIAFGYSSDEIIPLSAEESMSPAQKSNRTWSTIEVEIQNFSLAYPKEFDAEHNVYYFEPFPDESLNAHPKSLKSLRHNPYNQFSIMNEGEYLKESITQPDHSIDEWYKGDETENLPEEAVDFKLESFVPAENLVGYGTARFFYDISMNGNTELRDVYLQATLDGGATTEIAIGALRGSSRRYINFFGIPEGKHTLEITIDSQNAVNEIQKSNYTIQKTFEWMPPKGTLPDLTCQILPDVTYDEWNELVLIDFGVVIRNEGLVPTQAPVVGKLTSNGKLLTTFKIDNISAAEWVTGTVRIQATGLGKAPIELELDMDNCIKESNEGNNIAKALIPIRYCTHPGSIQTKGMNNDITIWVEKNSWNTEQGLDTNLADLAEELSSITDSVNITRIEYCDDIQNSLIKAKKGDIAIIYAEKAQMSNSQKVVEVQMEKNAAGQGIKMIRLNKELWNQLYNEKKDMIVTNTNPKTNQRKELIKALCHCIGLGNTTGNRDGTMNCRYPSAMRQTDAAGYPPSEHVTAHDMYNIMYFND